MGRRAKRGGGWHYTQVPYTQFGVNWDSPQSRGLVLWLPLIGPDVAGTQRFIDYIRKTIFVPTGANPPDWEQDSFLGIAQEQNGPNVEPIGAARTPVTGPPYTMSCWFKIPDVTTNYYLVSIGQVAVGNHFVAIRASGAVGGDPLEAIRVTGTADVTGTTSGYTAGAWYHACLSVAATDDITIYLNAGSETNDLTDKGAVGWDNVAIGTSADSSPTAYLTGRIADVRLYNRALTKAEIYETYAQATRWELFRMPRRTWMLGAAPPVVRIPRPPAAYNTLAIY